MDEKQFITMSQNRCSNELGGPDLDEIEKKSDDSHNRSAIDLINEAFGGSIARERRLSEGN